MAKTYLQANPSAKMIVLESAASVGGVWCKERLYPGLKSNNLLGSYEFSDFPMDEKIFDVKRGEHIPGPTLHEYLCRFAERFDIHMRIRFNCRVNTVEQKETGGWIIRSTLNGQVNNLSEKRSNSILTQKLVICTGLTSEPFIPSFIGSGLFDSPIFHAKYLYDHAPITTKTATNVVILGGSKSAYDAAYAYVSAGVTVDWVIRESGHGPAWMAPALVTPLKKRLEGLVGVRFLTWFSPCIWGDKDGFGAVRNFLHNTRLGRNIVETFWSVLANDVTTLNGYDRHVETKKLKPWTPAFWIGSSLSILNYPTDFFEYVRNGSIKVHVTDIKHLSPKTVHLTNGETLHADALISSTGWKHRPLIKFLPEGLDKQLGLPYRSTSPDDLLTEKADLEILQRFPKLAAQPVINRHYKALDGDGSPECLDRSFQLYRFMVPPAFINDRSIAYNGMMLSVHTTSIAQAQALWVTAYFSGHLPRTETPPVKGLATFDKEKVRWETILHNQFVKWRYPGGFGKRFPDIVFDGVPYIDMLLRDMGLKYRRKGGFWSELFHPYGPQDYVGLVDEWQAVVSHQPNYTI